MSTFLTSIHSWYCVDNNTVCRIVHYNNNKYNNYTTEINSQW